MNLEFNSLAIVTGVGAIGLAYFIAQINTKRSLLEAKMLMERKFLDDIKTALQEYKSSPEFISLLDLRFREGYQAGYLEATNSYKNSEEHEALLSIEHTKGKNAGLMKNAIAGNLPTPLLSSARSPGLIV